MANHLIPFRGLWTTAGCSLFSPKVTHLACHSERARAPRASRSACPDRSRKNLRFRPLAPVLIRTLGLIPGGVTPHLAVKALGGQKTAGATRTRDASLRRAL